MDSSILTSPILVCAGVGLLCYLLNRRLAAVSGLLALAGAAVALAQAVRIYCAEPMQYLFGSYTLKLGGLVFEAAMRSSALSSLLLLGVCFFGVIVLVFSLYKMRRIP